MKFLHLSDLHLISPGERLHGLDPSQQLRRCVASIREHHADASFCIVSGDLTHAGEPAAYDDARRALSDLPMPVHLMIGNHDDRAAFRIHFPEASCDRNGFVQQAFDTEIGRFLLLDTHVPASAAGRLCPQRLAWLAEQLAASDQPVYLCLHHPPFAVGLHRMDSIALAEPEKLLALLEPHRRRIRHIFLGHLHRVIAGSWNGFPVSCVRGTSHQVALDFITRERAPVSFESPGYAVVLADRSQVIVHSCDV